jgi:hypothetical protein
MDQHPKKRRRGTVEKLSAIGLNDALDAAVDSQGTAELAFLYLIDRYDFDPDELRHRLEGLYSLAR